jgi:hypothetical protein
MNKKMFISLTQNVFLCLAKDNKFECKQFKDFIEADTYFTDKCVYDVKSTMIDRCKFYPDSFREKTLKNNLDYLFGMKSEVKIVKDFNQGYLSGKE